MASSNQEDKLRLFRELINETTNPALKFQLSLLCNLDVFNENPDKISILRVIDECFRIGGSDEVIQFLNKLKNKLNTPNLVEIFGKLNIYKNSR